MSVKPKLMCFHSLCHITISFPPTTSSLLLPPSLPISQLCWAAFPSQLEISVPASLFFCQLCPDRFCLLSSFLLLLFLPFCSRNSCLSLRAQVIISLELSMSIAADQSCNFFFLYNLWCISTNVVVSPLQYSCDCSNFCLSP